MTVAATFKEGYILRFFRGESGFCGLWPRIMGTPPLDFFDTFPIHVPFFNFQKDLGLKKCFGLKKLWVKKLWPITIFSPETFCV